ACMKMDLESLRKTFLETARASPLSSAVKTLKSLAAAVDPMIATVRKIATELRPAVLDFGLEAAIEWQVQQFEERTGIKCEFKSEVRDRKLDPERATAVFRIFQEMLTNIVRQARATEASICLRAEGNQLILE